MPCAARRNNRENRVTRCRALVSITCHLMVVVTGGSLTAHGAIRTWAFAPQLVLGLSEPGYARDN